MKKLLIIGASVLQVPAIRKAKELGYYVGVLDINPNAPGMKMADKSYVVSTVDISGAIKAASEFTPDGVMTLATDMPMRVVASIADHFGLPGISPDVAIKATDKIAMIENFRENNVPSPWFHVVSSKPEFLKLIKNISLPFIMKPNDSSGSRGVILVDASIDAISAYEYSKLNSKSGLVLIEEYMEGPEVSVEIITVHGISTIIAITDKVTTGAPHFVETGHSQPSMLPSDTINQIKKVALKAIKSIGIDNSPSHVEIIVTKSGPKLVELGARLGGDCITTHLVPLSTGIDMVEATINLALGQDPAISQINCKGAAIRYFSSVKGEFDNVDGVDDVKKIHGVKHIEITKSRGDKIKNIEGSSDRIGYIICSADTPSLAIQLCEEALRKLKIKIVA